MQPSEQTVHLGWHGPLSFMPATGVACFQSDSIALNRYGMYLWTLPLDGSYLINYVGKVYGGNSRRTFATRFREELDYERKRGLCVDVESFFQGIRREVDWHHNDVERVLAAYRVFVAPLDDLGDSTFLEIEASLINALYDAGEKYGAFIPNRRRKKQFDGRISMDANATLQGFESYDVLSSVEPARQKTKHQPLTSVSVPVISSQAAQDRKEMSARVAQDRKEMSARVLKRARQYDSTFGDWLWGDYVVEFSSDCGIRVEKPEGEGKRDGRHPYRSAFAKCIRVVIPTKTYNYRVLTERIDHVVEAILRFHRRA